MPGMDGLETLKELKIINPDPWHKKRHFKRRLVNLENIIKIIGIVKNKKIVM